MPDHDYQTIQAENKRLRAEVEQLRNLINTPKVDDFLEAVRIEAAHQCERWGVDHDAGKADADWFWLVGYLAGKALHKPEKRLHHIITTAAACLNWHAYVTGLRTQMRPGISPPPSVIPETDRQGEEGATIRQFLTEHRQFLTVLACCTDQAEAYEWIASNYNDALFGKWLLDKCLSDYDKRNRGSHP